MTGTRMDGTEMAKQFLVIVICLTLFLFVAFGQDRKCSIVPTRSAAFVDQPHVLTCYGKPGTLMIQWRLGSISSDDEKFNASDNLPEYKDIISVLGVQSTIEPSSANQSDGYVTVYESVRKSVLTISPVKQDLAHSFYCIVLDFLDGKDGKALYCQTDLLVIMSGPVFQSKELNLTAGLITNLLCSITFGGAARINMNITDANDVVYGETTENYETSVNHDKSVSYQRTIAIGKETHRGSTYYRVSPDLGFQTVFQCTITFTDVTYSYLAKIEVDAPVSRVSITPEDGTRCTSRTCYMHARLVCASDGRPKPTLFEWLVSINYENYRPMMTQSAVQSTQESGRNTYECRVYNVIKDYTFTAAARFISHVQGYEWFLDDHATYISKGRSVHKVSCPMAIVVAVTAIVWILFTYHRRMICGHGV